MSMDEEKKKIYDIMHVAHGECGHPVISEIGEPKAWAPRGERLMVPCTICEVERLQDKLAILHPDNDATSTLTQEAIEERLEILQACVRRYRELLDAFRVKCPTCRCRILQGHECVCCAGTSIKIQGDD